MKKLIAFMDSNFFTILILLTIEQYSKAVFELDVIES